MPYYELIKDMFESIDREVMLNDVLLFLIENNKGTYTHFDSENNYFICGHRWDLLKPYLKDQSKSFIEYITYVYKLTGNK